MDYDKVSNDFIFGPWDDLPLELLTMIMNNLDIDKDRANKLACRLVSSKFKAAVDISLSQQTLSLWKVWDPTPTTNPSAQTSFPRLSQNHSVWLTENQAWPMLVSSLHSPLKIGNDHNPFPTRSVSISSLWKLRGDLPTLALHSIETFLTAGGKHLTSFHLHGVLITKPQVKLMMSKLTNLQALTFSSISFKKSPPSKATATVPPNSLRYVKLIHGSDPVLVQWLVDLLASQLVNLEVDATKLRPFLKYPMPTNLNRDQNNPSTSAATTAPTAPPKMSYGNLTKLKVINVNKLFLHQTVELNLHHLSIINLAPNEGITLKDLVGLLDKFSSSLKSLYFDVRLAAELELEEDISSPITFPYLTKLHVQLPENFMVCERAYRQLLPRFPALKLLILFYQLSKVPNVRVFSCDINSLYFWEICPRLEKVVLTSDKNSMGHHFEFEYLRTDFEERERRRVAMLNIFRSYPYVMLKDLKHNRD